MSTASSSKRSSKLFGRLLGRSGRAASPPPPPPSYDTSASPGTAVPPMAKGFRSSYVAPRGDEDPLELLKEYDTVFLVDDSGSMGGSRWKEACKAIMEVADIAARYDDDGIDIYFLNSKRYGVGLSTTSQVAELFRSLEPKGITPTAARLDVLLREYMGRLEAQNAGSTPGEADEVKPINLIVITDGAPSDDPASVIVAAAKRLDKGEYPLSQVGIQFLQIGSDPKAAAALEELDDELGPKHGIRDIVDTVPYKGKAMNADLIIKTLLGGINRRLDKRGN
ncbi:hypothetical protein B9479_003085 [Cryptococcus floricola]|uniref:VWFA domain-containing protein n=1 Tax=Cryptococcus floricola TaxID=2591691 RepID=A0A5D3B1P8_9TREE|nr:hypothetical protein B9479_003085 [Cryptococcus floricola]